MGKRILMNASEGDECRIAVVEDGKLYEYFVDRPSQLKHLGNIYKGIVSNVEPGIQAAFVDLGLDRNGFLHVSDTLNAYSRIQNVTELYHAVTRAAGASEMPPYTEQVPQAATQDEGFADDEGETPEPGTGERSETQIIDDEDRQRSEAQAEREEPDFLDKLNQVAPGHNVTHSPTEVLADSGDSGRMPAVKAPSDSEDSEDSHVAPEQSRRQDSKPARPHGHEASTWTPGWEVRDEAASSTARKEQASAARPAAPQRQPEPEPLPDVVPGKVSEHEELGIKPEPKTPRKKRAPLEIFKAEPPATDFKLPAPPKKKRSGMFHAVPAPSDTPASEAKPNDEGGKDANGSFDRDGNPTGDDGSSTPPRRFMRGPLPKIQNLLKRGQEVMIQVTKASQGGKGPGLSTFLSLPGRYMVLMPNSNKGGVSRKIEDESQRDALRKILDSLPVPEGMGVVIRTAAIGRSYDELSRDLNYLLRLWNVIVTRIYEAPAPALIYADSDPAIRAVRDYFTADTDEIVIDDKPAYERVLAFFDATMPSFKERVKLYEGDAPLFFAEGIETQIDHIFDKKVPLKSGGYLYIEQTEALVAIDVNSGKFTSAGDAEQTAYRTNIEAIPEIVRQLRLRDLGGIICNDFIDMLAASHRADVENALKRELRKDRARTKIARMSPFGVIEMTRQRVRPSIRAYTYVPCPTCTGSGHVRSAETLCLTLIRHMKLALSEERVKSLLVQVHPHVLSHLHSEFREDIDQLEERYDKRIIFEYARDLVLGDARIFYVNDRDLRVLYDLDQKINQYVREVEHQSKINVPLPPASLGVAGAPEPEQRNFDRRGRRGGKRQRDRDLERQSKLVRTAEENAKAVPSFGADMPELPSAPAGTPVAAPSGNGGNRDRFRGGRDRDRGRRHERHGAPQQGQPAPQNGEPVAAAQEPGVAPIEGAAAPTVLPGSQPAQAGAPMPGAPNRPNGEGGKRRRGRRGGRRRREREERRRQLMGQGQPQGAPGSTVPQGESAAGAAPGSAPAQQTSGEQAPASAPAEGNRRGRTGRRPRPESAPAPQAAPAPVPVESVAAPAAPVEAEPKKRATRKKAEAPAEAEAEPKKRAPRKKAEAAEKPAKKPAAKKPAAKKPAAKKK